MAWNPLNLTERDIIPTQENPLARKYEPIAPPRYWPTIPPDVRKEMDEAVAVMFRPGATRVAPE